MGVSNTKTLCDNCYMDAGMKLSRKIKELRKKRGLTQEQLAESINTSYKYLQRLESKTPPDIRLSTIIKISRALRIKPAELLKF